MWLSVKIPLCAPSLLLCCPVNIWLLNIYFFHIPVSCFPSPFKSQTSNLFSLVQDDIHTSFSPIFGTPVYGFPLCSKFWVFFLLLSHVYLILRPGDRGSVLLPNNSIIKIFPSKFSKISIWIIEAGTSQFQGYNLSSKIKLNINAPEYEFYKISPWMKSQKSWLIHLRISTLKFTYRIELLIL